MIVPQPTQRYTGYSSEGSRNLLDAVMTKRQTDAAERRDKRDFAFRKEQYDRQQQQLEDSKIANKALADSLDAQRKQQERVMQYYREREKFGKNKGSIGSVSLMDLYLSPFLLAGLRRFGIARPSDGSITLPRYLHGLVDPTIYDREFDRMTGGAPQLNPIPYNPNVTDREMERQRIILNNQQNDPDYYIPQIRIEP